jgi:hypothetical protein
MFSSACDGPEGQRRLPFYPRVVAERKKQFMRSFWFAGHDPHSLSAFPYLDVRIDTRRAAVTNQSLIESGFTRPQRKTV